MMMSPTVRFKLNTEAYRIEGRLTAYRFALECDADVERIKQEIEQFEARLQDPEAAAKGKPFAPNTSVRLHAEGYVPALREIMRMIADSPNESPS